MTLRYAAVAVFGFGGLAGAANAQSIPDNSLNPTAVAQAAAQGGQGGSADATGVSGDINNGSSFKGGNSTYIGGTAAPTAVGGIDGCSALTSSSKGGAIGAAGFAVTFGGGSAKEIIVNERCMTVTTANNVVSGAAVLGDKDSFEAAAIVAYDVVGLSAAEQAAYDTVQARRAARATVEAPTCPTATTVTSSGVTTRTVCRKVSTPGYNVQ